MPLVANCTTKQYFRYSTEHDRMNKLKKILISKKYPSNHWRRTDHIVLVPEHMNNITIMYKNLHYVELFSNRFDEDDAECKENKKLVSCSVNVETVNNTKELVFALKQCYV